MWRSGEDLNNKKSSRHGKEEIETKRKKTEGNKELGESEGGGLE